MSHAFGIAARHENGTMRLFVRGELDLNSVTVLEEELSQARTVQLDHLILDLSGLEFVDARGAAAVARTAEDARVNGWTFEVKPSRSVQVRRLFELLDLAPPQPVQLAP